VAPALISVAHVEPAIGAIKQLDKLLDDFEQSEGRI
jgi:hypothetical protein